MKYIAIIAVLALLLLTAGCAVKKGIEIVEPDAEQQKAFGDISFEEEELAVEDIEIDTDELEALDM